MTFSLSISLFFVIVVFYIVIVKAFIILFRITGLTEEKARFQVISLITNSGYTTQESELVVSVLARRKLARIIMLFGYTFSITIVSVFVNAMIALPSSEKDEVWPALLIVSTLFVVFLIVWRIPVVKIAMDSILERLGRKWLYGDHGNVILVQDEYPRGVVASVTLNTLPADIAGKTLRQLNLPAQYGVHVVFINRHGVIQIDTSGKTVLQEGDVATVFGPIKAIRQVFENPVVNQSPLPTAPKPETEVEFIHKQDVEKAREAAERAHAEQQEKDSASARAAAQPKARADTAPVNAQAESTISSRVEAPKREIAGKSDAAQAVGEASERMAAVAQAKMDDKNSNRTGT